MCLWIETSDIWCVSVIASANIIFFFHFCFIDLTTFIDLYELINQFIEVCLLPLAGGISSSHFRDNLPMICWLAFCISSFLLLHALFWSLRFCKLYHHGRLFNAVLLPCVHGPSSSLCPARFDPVGRNVISLQVSIFWLSYGCLSNSAALLLSSLFHNTGCLLNLGSMPLVSLLNRSVAGLGKTGTDQCFSDMQ